MIFAHIQPSTSKAAVELLTAFELPESIPQEDTSTFKASTTGLWSILGILPSPDIVSIDQTQEVANSLTRIAYTCEQVQVGQSTIAETHSRPSVWIDWEGFYVDPCAGGRFQSTGYPDTLRPSFLRRAPVGTEQREQFKPYRNDERERYQDHDNAHPSRRHPNALCSIPFGTPSQKLGEDKANGGRLVEGGVRSG